MAYLDRREREPWWLATLAYLWGAVVATGLALALNATVADSVAKLFDETTAIADTTALGIQVVDPAGLFVWLETGFVAPLLEEAVKGIALVMLFMLLPTEANSMRDGIVYGALVGLGFAVMETTVYITTAYAATGVAPYVSQIVPRFALFGVSGHALYSAIFGAGLGMARQSLTYGRVRRFLAPFGAFLLAVSAHAMSNVFGPYAFAAAASLTGTATDGMVSVGQLWVLSLVEIVSVNLWALVSSSTWGCGAAIGSWTWPRQSSGTRCRVQSAPRSTDWWRRRGCGDCAASAGFRPAGRPDWCERKTSWHSAGTTCAAPGVTRTRTP